MPTPSATPGFKPAPVNSTEWNAQVVQANAEAQQRATADRTTPVNQGGPLDLLLKPVEAIGSKIHSVYTNVVSRPLTTALLAPMSVYANSNGSFADTWDKTFSASTWDKAYENSAHVSPGQAFTLGATEFFTTNSREKFKQDMMKPVMYKPKDITGKQAIDENGKPIEVNLNKTGFIWDNPDAMQIYFDHGVQKWVSGSVDFAASWYLDPLVLGGKAAGALRATNYVRPAFETERMTLGKKALQTVSGGKLGQIKTTNNIQKNLDSSAFTKLGDRIMNAKGTFGAVQGPTLPGQTLPGSRFEDWATRQPWAKNSSDSGNLAAALGRARDRDEVNNVLAIAMGDETARASLALKNADLGAQMQLLRQQQKGLISNFSSRPGAQSVAQQQLQLKSLADSLAKIGAQSANFQKRIDLASSMKNGMYFTPGISKVLSNFGQYARGLETVTAKGSSLIGLPGKAGASLIYNNLYVRPVRVISGTTWRGIRAPGHINLDAEDGYRAFGASLDQSKMWTKAEQQQMVSKYIGADQANRSFVVEAADRATVGRIAARHGLNEAEASALYQHVGGLKANAKDGNIFSTAYIDTPGGGRLRADRVEDDGGLVVTSPVLNTQLESTKILTDYEHMDRVLKYTAPMFKKLFREGEIRARAAIGGPVNLPEMQAAAREAREGSTSGLGGKALKALTVGKDMSDVAGKLWKFSVLLRLGYGPRAIADDFMGQAAYFGAYNLFVERALGGARNSTLRNWNKMLNDPTQYEQQFAALESGMGILSSRAATYERKIEQVQRYLPPTKSYVGTGARGRRQMNQRTTLLADYQQRLDETRDQIDALRQRSNQLGKTKNALGDNYIIAPDGKAFARPFEGAQGALFKDLNSGVPTINTVMGGTASEIWNQYRTGNWRVIEGGEADHLSAWLKDVQYQIANDDAAMAYLQGQSLESWFGTKAGRAYKAKAPIANMTDAERANRIEAHIDHYLPNDTPETAALRQAVSIGAKDSRVAELMKAVPNDHLPPVQSEGLAYAMGKGDMFQHIDNMMTGFYEKMNRLPSEILSRNPLFFQLYRQHVLEIYQGAKDGGLSKLSTARQAAMEEQARKLALKDVKKFTFNMDFESKLAYKMRFVAPFFGPMQESFSRWGRIAADRPETLSRAAQIYTAPIHAGHAVDKDGNPVDANGYSVDKDGNKVLVNKADMHLQFQVPGWAAKALSLDGGTMVDMPIDTLNLVLQNDPWYNPGTGPWVQIPANWTALRTDPSVGDAMKKLGILQNVTPDTRDQLLGSTPKFISALLGGQDYEQQQKDMIYLMQAEDYKFKNGMRATEPKQEEIKARVEHSAYMRAFMKTVLPVSANFKDPYQFFRDRYQELQQADPKTADQIYLAKYGDAAFAFTGALSKSAKGLPSTVEAVRADKKFAYLTDANPDLAALIIGPYASGDFSQTAYIQQLGSHERGKLSAEDSMKMARENLGWAQFDKYMNSISAKLYQAGFKSFSDRGAEQFDAQRKGVISMLTLPRLPDGRKNPYYNPEFDQAYNTVDRTKDQRKAEALNQLVTEKALIDDPMRSDIRSLAQYMNYRNAATQILTKRDQAGGSADINAKQNVDIKNTLHTVFNSLRESDTLFQSLHDRFLSRDMFDHFDPAFGKEV